VCLIPVSYIRKAQFLNIAHKTEGREMWLSPVIQATWEARAVGWLEVLRLLRANRWNFRSALRLPTMLSGGQMWYWNPDEEN
jgi:hypothetical protein